MPGLPPFSVVQRSHVETDAQARRLVLEVLDEVKHLEVDHLLWWIRASTSPDTMPSILHEFGFSLTEDVEILYLDLAEFPERGLPGTVSSEIACSVVTDYEGLRLANQILEKAMTGEDAQDPDPTQASQELELLRLAREGELSTDAAPVSVAFIAWEGQEPIATAAFWIKGVTAHFWGAATEKDHRGKGAYKRLVAARCEMARQMGAQLALTKARSGTSGPILTRMGFTHAGEQFGFEKLLSAGQHSG